jgi:hypothetical protein
MNRITARTGRAGARVLEGITDRTFDLNHSLVNKNWRDMAAE